jgi:hypothetical protein
MNIKSTFMRIRKALATAIVLSSVLGANLTMAVEEPKFETLLKDEAFEIRRYPSLVVATTQVPGDMDAASNRGFRTIADYIFGNNVATPAGASAKIAMTAPVTLTPMPPATPAASTVTSDMAAEQWQVEFVMPGQYRLDTLPRPKNEAVTLRELPARTTAVLSYSWLNSEAKVQQKTDELRAWMKARQLEPLSAPRLARYDPPWTLPMWRRNEIQIDIRSP